MIRVLDMCCGTGCVGIAIAKHIPSAHITAVDIEQKAIELTAQNAKLNHIAPDRFRVMTSNMFECFLEPLPTIGHEHNKHKLWANQSNIGDTEKLNCDNNSRATRRVASEYTNYFDALVCNPPYILPNEYDTLAPSVRLWESKVALVGDIDRASRQYTYFKEILEYGAQLLKDARHRLEYMRDVPNIVIEVGLQAELVASMMESSGLYDEVEIHLDMAQRQRWISALSK